jgi:hypothetical protein
MLSALVILRRPEDNQFGPGNGFFVAARELGLDTSDRLQCWTEEVRKVFEAWAP